MYLICAQVYTYCNPGQNIWPRQKNPVKLDRKRNALYLLCVFFDCYCQFLLSGGETGRRAMSPHKFEIFPVFLNFLRSYVLSCSACFTRYQILFNLWRLRSILKHRKGTKYYDQDCRSISVVSVRSIFHFHLDFHYD